MKKVVFLVAITLSATSFAQNSGTSFEEPEIFNEPYTDTGEATVAHDLVNNPNEALVDYNTVGGEIGFDARYVPYDIPGVGLTDGDAVGVSLNPPTSNDPFPNGENGYIISDVDGNYIVEFDPVFISSPTVSINYFIAETGYEGDGTLNASGSDRLRIYVKDITNALEYDILNTTGSDINDLSIEGQWLLGSVTLSNSPNITAQLIIEARNNSGAEAFYFDNVSFDGILGFDSSIQEKFQVYPNPADSKIYIHSKTDDDLIISIYNLLGQEVIYTNLVSNTLDVSRLKSGIYLLNITQGTHTTTHKVVIK